MPCQTVRMPNGTAAIVCGPKPRRRKCSACGRNGADLLCDWKVPAKKSGTCDKPICSKCTFSPAPDKDLCTAHALEFGLWKARRRPHPTQPLREEN